MLRCCCLIWRKYFAAGKLIELQARRIFFAPFHFWWPISEAERNNCGVNSRRDNTRFLLGKTLPGTWNIILVADYCIWA